MTFCKKKILLEIAKVGKTKNKLLNGKSANIKRIYQSMNSLRKRRKFLYDSKTEECFVAPENFLTNSQRFSDPCLKTIALKLIKLPVFLFMGFALIKEHSCLNNTRKNLSFPKEPWYVNSQRNMNREGKQKMAFDRCQWLRLKTKMANRESFRY